MAIVTDTRAHSMSRTGIGLRLPHLSEVVATRPPAGWLEIHPENFLANPHATELLIDLAADYPISVHTVGISIGSNDGIDREHLERLRLLVDRLDPVLVSGHLAWSSHGGVYLNDLLPLPYTRESLRIVSDHLREVQDRLGRRYLIENPSAYVAFADSTFSELEFLHELVERTRCELLCDVSNVYLSAHNMGFDAYAYIDAFPGDAVRELHLGGFTAEQDEGTPGGTLLVDTHASRLTQPVWSLYAYVLERFGRRPTIVEWDSDMPSLDELCGEAITADRVASLQETARVSA